MQCLEYMGLTSLFMCHSGGKKKKEKYAQKNPHICYCHYLAQCSVDMFPWKRLGLG